MIERLLVFLVLSCLLLAACGEEASSPEPLGSVSSEASRAGTGDLLEDLRTRLDGGGEVLDDAWIRAVGEVAVLLWPDASGSANGARRTHHNLALIAGDVTVQLLVEGEGGRARFAQRDPTSLAIHDAFRAALAEGPDAYRAWVEGAGRQLLERRMEALQGG